MHTYDETKWVTDETFHWHPATCEHTGEKKDVAKHEKDAGTILEDATTEKKGKILFKCATCQRELGTEDIPQVAIEVTVEKPLAATLVAMNLENTTSLRLIGTLSDDDFATLKDMASLKELDITEVTNETIPEFAFLKASFETINFPKNLKTIEKGAFRESSLIEAILPNGLETIGDAAFIFANDLTKLYIPSTVQSVGRWIIEKFDEDEVKWSMPEDAKAVTVIIENGVKELAPSAFWGAKIKEINIPDSIKVIPDSCFAESMIDKIELSDKIEFIGNEAFINSYLILENKILVLPAELKVIGPNAFSIQNGEGYDYNVKFNDKLEYIYQEAFVTGFVIEEFEFPATLKGFAKSSLTTRTGLQRVIFKGETPPELIPYYKLDTITYSEGKYTGTEEKISPQDPKAYRDVVAYVPAGSLEKYKTALVCDDNLNPFGKENVKSIEELK